MLLHTSRCAGALFPYDSGSPEWLDVTIQADAYHCHDPSPTSKTWTALAIADSITIPIPQAEQDLGGWSHLPMTIEAAQARGRTSRKLMVAAPISLIRRSPDGSGIDEARGLRISDRGLPCRPCSQHRPGIPGQANRSGHCRWKAAQTRYLSAEVVTRRP